MLRERSIMTQPTLLEAVIFIALGLVALLLGKRLFWVFAGIVGFALGWWLTSFIPQDLLRIVVGVIVGLILAGLSRFLGKWAIRIVAAIAGFVILPIVLGNLRMMGGISELVWAILGALLGFVFAWVAAKWALIVLSSVVGAALIVDGAGALLFQLTKAPMAETVQLIVGVILLVFGIIVQSRQKD
jgi:hypothetical protein